MTTPQQFNPSYEVGAAPAIDYPTAPNIPDARRTAAPKYNLFSLISFVGVFVMPIVGVVFGHVALKQISSTGEPGHGFARAGLIIGYVSIGVGVVAVATYVFLLLFMIATVDAGSYYYD